MCASVDILDLALDNSNYFGAFLFDTVSTTFCGGLIQIVDSFCLCGSYLAVTYLVLYALNLSNTRYTSLTFFFSGLSYCLHNPSVFHWLAN